MNMPISRLADLTTPENIREFKLPDRVLYGYTPVLIVEDEPAVRKALRTLLESWGCIVLEAGDGAAALRTIVTYDIRLVLSDIDMPVMDGFDLLESITREHPDVSVIMVSGMGHEKIIDEALARGAIGYVQKPYRIPELKSQLTYALRKIKLTADTAASGLSIPPVTAKADLSHEFARLFVMTSDLHHVETGSHIRRIGKFSRLLAELVGLQTAFCTDLGEAAVLHDIGKLAIPDAILKKPGPLTPEEFEIMKTHPLLGGQILSGVNDPLLKLAHTVALHHHERWDGNGYPGKLKGENCPIEARIVGVVDVFDALAEKRVYKDAWSKEKITEFFNEKKGEAFEERLVNQLLENYSLFEEIRLSENIG